MTSSQATGAVLGVAGEVPVGAVDLHPDAVLRSCASANDLDKPGVDDIYGHGRVDAATAVGLE